MVRWVCAAALAGIVSGCITPDQDKLYGQVAGLHQTGAVKPATDTIRSAKLSEPQQSVKTAKPQIVLGEAY